MNGNGSLKFLTENQKIISSNQSTIFQWRINHAIDNFHLNRLNPEHAHNFRKCNALDYSNSDGNFSHYNPQSKTLSMESALN